MIFTHTALLGEGDTTSGAPPGLCYPPPPAMALLTLLGGVGGNSPSSTGPLLIPQQGRNGHLTAMIQVGVEGQPPMCSP